MARFTRRCFRYRAAQTLGIHPRPIEAAGASLPFGEHIAAILDPLQARLFSLGGLDPLDPVPARDGSDVRPYRPRLRVGGRESLPQIGRHLGSGSSATGAISSETSLPTSAPAASRNFRSTLSQWPPWPSGSRVARKGWLLMSPSTVVMPREGSFALASFGRMRKVHELPFGGSAGRKSLAVKRLFEVHFTSSAYNGWIGLIATRGQPLGCIMRELVKGRLVRRQRRQTVNMDLSNATAWFATTAMRLSRLWCPFGEVQQDFFRSCLAIG